jgi:predicted RNase H-like HicB family nuclease
MKRKLNVKIERKGKLFNGFCSEFPGIIAEGRTLDECRQNLITAIEFVLKNRPDESNGNDSTLLGGS